MANSKRSLLRFSLYLAILASFSCTIFAQTATASEDLLGRLRQEVREKGYTFEVGHTPALEEGVENLCGVREEQAPEGPVVNPLVLKDGRSMTALSLPSHYDWREQNGVTPVRNQGRCGGCWAFATIGVMESVVRIKEGIVVDLSEQYLLDCNRDFYGCNGGNVAFNWMTKNGSVLETEDPYQAANGTCASAVTRMFYPQSFAYVSGSKGVASTDGIKQAIYLHGPVYANVYAGALFGAYKSGVFNASESGSVNVNHGIVLVGWDDAEGCWILRNSWGSGWGDNGYMKIRYGISNVGWGAAYVNYEPPATPELAYVSSSTRVAGGSSWERQLHAGRTSELFVSLGNVSGPANSLKATLTSTDSACEIVKGSATYASILRFQSATSDEGFQIRVKEGTKAGHKISFTLTVGEDYGYRATFRFTIPVDLPPALILNLDAAGSSAQALAESMADNGVASTVATSLSAAGDLDPWQSVFVCLGTGDSRHVLSTSEAANLKEYLQMGGNLYLEGGDTFSADSRTALHDLLGAHASANGGNRPAGIQGGQAGPWQGLSAELGADESAADFLNADSGAGVLATSSQGEATFGVFQSNTTYRSAAVSLRFSSLASRSARTQAAGSLLRFFGVTTRQAGDLNGDGKVDATDVELLHGLLSEESVSSSALARADLNGDGRIGVEDLMQLRLAVEGKR